MLTNHELSVFFRETALLLKAGITPLEGVRGLRLEAKADPVLQTLEAHLEQGEPFHTSMEAAGVFPAYVTGMVRIGEEAGSLDTVLSSLSDHYEREETIKESVRNAVTYPCLMIAMMLVVVLVLIMRVLPVFAQVFEQLGSGMNAFSEALLSFGFALNRYAFVLLVVLALIVGIFLYLYLTASGRQKAARFAQVFPPTRRISRDIAAGRFASAMALILKSGIPVNEETMEMTKRLTNHAAFNADIDYFYSLVEKDAMPIPEALQRAGIFNSLYGSLLRAAFQSGNQDEVMEQIAAHYEADTDRRIYRLIGVIEPTLVILLSLIVGGILLSVILPLMGVMSNIG